MQVVVQPSDFGKALHSMGAFEDPKGVAGKIVGLGRDELEAGVPTWAWCTVVFVVGFVVGGKFAREIPVVKEMF